MSTHQNETTCPVRISRQLHRRVKTAAVKRGMKIQSLAEQAFKLLLAKPTK
jgi:predicted DNA binding CopG/RHH family protein